MFLIRLRVFEFGEFFLNVLIVFEDDFGKVLLVSEDIEFLFFIKWRFFEFVEFFFVGLVILVDVCGVLLLVGVIEFGEFFFVGLIVFVDVCDIVLLVKENLFFVFDDCIFWLEVREDEEEIEFLFLIRLRVFNNDFCCWGVILLVFGFLYFMLDFCIGSIVLLFFEFCIVFEIEEDELEICFLLLILLMFCNIWCICILFILGIFFLINGFFCGIMIFFVIVCWCCNIIIGFLLLLDDLFLRFWYEFVDFFFDSCVLNCLSFVCRFWNVFVDDICLEFFDILEVKVCFVFFLFFLFGLENVVIIDCEDDEDVDVVLVL